MNAIAPPSPGLVSEAARAQFQRDGYFVLPGAIPPAHLAAMRATCDEFIGQFTRAPFMTEDGSRLRWFAEPVLKGGVRIPAPQATPFPAGAETG